MLENSLLGNLLIMAILKRHPTLLCVFKFLIVTCTVDYRFLEDTGRFAEGATRDSLMRTPRTTLKVSPSFID